MEEDKYLSLRLESQLCFPLYACSKEIIKKYQPYLKELDLTYTQYIVMLSLWEYGTMGLSAIGDLLYLDSGTLTPVIKKLETKGYISKTRSGEDERNVNISLTEKGLSLRDDALSVPKNISSCIKLTESEARALYGLLYKILGKNV